MEIGTKFFHRGDEVTVTSEPFILHGGEFQKVVNNNGKELVVATKNQSAQNAKNAQNEWTTQQRQFSKLNK